MEEISALLYCLYLHMVNWINNWIMCVCVCVRARAHVLLYVCMYECIYVSALPHFPE